MQLTGRSRRAAIATDNSSSSEHAAQVGQTRKNGIELKPAPVRNSRHTDLIVRDRRNISLPHVTPVHLDHVAPRGHAVMSPETDALASQRTALQPRPTPHPGPLTVSAH